MALNPTYSVGTVSVSAGETSVSGVGTLWLAAGIQAGDIFELGGLTATIASVAGNTSLVLARAWPGATGAGLQYEIRFTPDATRVLSSARQVVAQLDGGNLPALSGLPSAANTLPYFSGPGVAALTPISSIGRDILAQTTPQAVRAALGLAGYAAAGIRIQGTVPNIASLPSSGNVIGDAYLVNGNLYVWGGTSPWLNAGQISGPPGMDGTQVYPSRAAAVSQAPNLSATVTAFFVQNGNSLEVRSRTATADDPLFTTAPQWGVISRVGVDDVLRQIDPDVVTINAASPSSARSLNVYTARRARLILNPASEGGVITNLPTGAVAPPIRALVENSPFGNVVRQTYEEPATGNRWSRDYSGSTWGAWKLLTEQVLRLTSGSSAGDRTSSGWRNPGMHIEITAATISGIPPSGSGTVTARVDVERTGAALLQTWVFSDGKKWTRLSTDEGVNWSAWVEQVAGGSGAEPPAINISVLSAGQRTFNAHVIVGQLYTMDGSAAILNGPSGTQSYSGSMRVSVDGPDLVQSLWLTGSDIPYRRRVRNGTPDAGWTRSAPGFEGQTIVFLGDSITHGVGTTNAATDAFPVIVAGKLGCLYLKAGTAGAQMDSTTASAQAQKDGSFVEAVALALATIAVSGRVVVAFGTNDFNRSTPIGSITDTARGTFYGAMREGVAAIIAANPAAKIAFITPTYRAVSSTDDAENLTANSAGHTLEAYRTAIRAFAARFAYQVIEGRDGVGINELNIGVLAPDGLHPANAGAKILGEHVARRIS